VGFLAPCWDALVVARGQGARAQKASAHWISDFELRISDFEFFFFNPHSAIKNPQFPGAAPQQPGSVVPGK
jgi:hypothetical protein